MSETSAIVNTGTTFMGCPVLLDTSVAGSPGAERVVAYFNQFVTESMPRVRTPEEYEAMARLKIKEWQNDE